MLGKILTALSLSNARDVGYVPSVTLQVETVEGKQMLIAEFAKRWQYGTVAVDVAHFNIGEKGTTQLYYRTNVNQMPALIVDYVNQEINTRHYLKTLTPDIDYGNVLEVLELLNEQNRYVKVLRELQQNFDVSATLEYSGAPNFVVGTDQNDGARYFAEVSYASQNIAVLVMVDKSKPRNNKYAEILTIDYDVDTFLDRAVNHFAGAGENGRNLKTRTRA